ncbi:protein O-mannosyl-transferase 2 isoform X10 [Odontomachus brunneus]|uniref:protein O-mannosyl-transferase 2 isoform X10 n=1 Tax=Odontomachus brunneus TaxID=486640 RepID=UPI0013F22BC6|nr:protein O-mannosyl-transferase 2 isoform X10 [Odontomachus brunneus]
MKNVSNIEKITCSSKNMMTSQVNKKEENVTNWWLLLGCITMLTLLTRFYKVTEPQHVCWDETHFGKMGNWYINRTFFFDVHPPLGKMLIALSGYITGYDGTFAFEKPGDKFENVNYIGMRIFCTSLGASIVPLSYLIVWDLTKSTRASSLAAIFILFDVGLLTLNQYILLDPILLCFMMCATWGMVRVASLRNQPFTCSWWLWLSFTGASLACTISVKFVGLFVVLLVGLYTVHELWRELGDLSNSISYVGRHLLARCFCLILLPVLLYMLFFYIHLSVLNKSGSGDGFYSSEFQSLLRGNSLYNATMPRQLAYGASITLKNHRTGGGYLHSHWHLYPEGIGARQQQITTYSHKDDNNLWLVKKFDSDEMPSEAMLVKHGDLIRLEHVITRRNLHSHKEIAPISKKHYQVTGYGENGTGDANDVWKILITNGKDGDVVETVTSKLKFIHYLHHCVLTCNGKTLPKWLQLPDVDIFIEIYSWCMLEFLNFIKMLRWQLICLAPCAQGSESLSISSRISALESVSSTRLRQIHRRGIWIFLASLFLFRPSAFPPWITVGEVLPVMYATLNLLIWVMGNLSVGLPVVARGVDRTSRLFPYSARLLRSSPTRGSRHRHPQRYASSIAQVTPLGGTFIAAGPKCTAALA